MANILDYVRWRGDLSFRQDSFNEVDAVVFSALSYIEYGGRVLNVPREPLSLKEATVDFLAEGDVEHRVRVKSDLELLRLAAASYRFGQSQITQYRSIYEPEEETQFAAMTFLLDDGSAFVTFRGTDGTLVGWKEDFNMTFQQTIPAQLLAQQYVREIALERSEPLRLGGHSKGGNLAVFAAARSSPMIQERILEVYNNDGPGFTDYLMGDPGYLAIVSSVRTFIPQSSVIGMLLEHEEPYTVVHSKSVGVLQHDLYTWDLMGNRLITMDNTTGDSVFLDTTIKNWFASMTSQQRNALVDAMYGLLSLGGAENVTDILQPKNLKMYFKALSGDENLRRLFSTEFSKLIESAKKAYAQLDQRREAEKLLEDAKENRGLFSRRPEEKDVTTLYLVRHCEANHQNHNDVERELTPKGLKDRQMVTEYFEGKEIRAVISSPYKRAEDTVMPLAESRGLPVIRMEDFRERRVGQWVEDFDSFAKRQWEDDGFCISDGESLAQVRERMVRGLGEVLTRYPNQEIVISSHGTAISVLMHHFAPQFGYEDFQRLKDEMPFIVACSFQGSSMTEFQIVHLI